MVNLHVPCWSRTEVNQKAPAPLNWKGSSLYGRKEECEAEITFGRFQFMEAAKRVDLKSVHYKKKL